jgi:hypothetical protein
MQWDLVWKAGVVTAVIFAVGIGLGMWMDLSRVGSVQERLTAIDLEWNDARLQSLYFSTLNSSAACEAAIRANLDFNGKIYAEGQTIEQYEKINRFAPDLIQQKKRYALLQFQFWLNSMSLKKNCGANYTTFAYFYSHYDTSLEMDQNLQSAALLQLKEECGDSVLLVPLPLDMGLTSVDILKSTYGINSAPSILVDETEVLKGLQGLPELEKIVKC